MLTEAAEQIHCTKTKLFLSDKEEAVKKGEWNRNDGFHITDRCFILSEKGKVPHYINKLAASFYAIEYPLLLVLNSLCS